MINKFRELFKESFVYSAGNIIVKIGGFIVIPLYLKYTSLEIVGLIALFDVVFQFLQAISGWGVKGGFQRWYYDIKTAQDRKALFFTCYTFNITSTLWASLLIFIILWLFSFQIFDVQIGIDVIIYFCLATFFRLLLDVPYIIQKLLKKAVAQTTFQVINVMMMMGLTYWFLEYEKMGLKGIFLAQFLANAATFTMLIPTMLQNSYFQFKKSDLKDMVRFGLPLVLSNILAIVFTLSDRFIINAFHSGAEVGSFSIAYKIASIIQFVIIAPFLTSYTFDYYKNMNEKVKDRFHLKSFTYFVYFMVLTSMGLTLFAKEAIDLLSEGKTDLSGAIPVIPVLLLGLVFSGMRQVFQLPLVKAKNTRLISLISIVAGIINFAFNMVAVPSFGKIGASVATALAHFIAAIWFLKSSKRYGDETFELHKISKSIFIGFAIMTIYLLIPIHTLWLDWIIRIGYFLLFFVLLYLLKGFEHHELLAFKMVWDKWKNIHTLKSNIQSLRKN
jgi:O-antigen/teichoic acid export membrane protein